LEWAKDKIILGSAKESAIITEENKLMTSYHEGGHSLVALYTKGAVPLHKVTVIPRGNALGLTVQLPTSDITGYTKAELYAMLDVCMGGRVAEELIYGSESVTTGASNDLEKATSVARQMVLKFGMSDKIGLTSFSSEAYAEAGSETKAKVEVEVANILEQSYMRAMKLLSSKKDELHKLAKALVDYETLDIEQVKYVIKGNLF
jgi:ATP-dependent metalloprotease